MKNLLLFRICHEDGHKFPAYFLIGQDGDLFSFDEDNGLNKQTRAGFRLDRCTGLKDKLGNIIYENDILYWPDYDCKTKVIWNEKEAKFEWGILDKMPQIAIVQSLEKQNESSVQKRKKR